MPPFDPESLTDMMRLLDSEVQVLVLVRGTLPDGREHHAYASIPPSRYSAFKAAEAKGNYDLADYGTILAHGEGLEPSDELKKQMEEEHGADHIFEEQLDSLVSHINSQKT